MGSLMRRDLSEEQDELLFSVLAPALISSAVGALGRREQELFSLGGFGRSVGRAAAREGLKQLFGE